jgi:hypothetical protein
MDEVIITRPYYAWEWEKNDKIFVALALSVEFSELVHGLPLFQHIPVVYLALGGRRIIVGTRIFLKGWMVTKFPNKRMAYIIQNRRIFSFEVLPIFITSILFIPFFL